MALVFKILLGLFLLRVIVRIYRKNKNNSIIKSAESRITGFREATVEKLLEDFEYLSTQIQLHPKVPKLYFFRAIVAAKLSTLIDNKEKAKEYYKNSTFDINNWTRYPSDAGGPDTPAMDTQFVSNLRREGGKNFEFRDIVDEVGDIGNGLSTDELFNKSIVASAIRDEKLNEEKDTKSND